MNLLRFILFCTFSSCVITLTKAWSQQPHLIIASIAYNNITRDTYNKVYNQSLLFKSFYPDYSDPLSIAVWADVIKEYNDTYYSTWHYIDIPYTNHTNITVKRPSNINVVWALESILNSYKKHTDTWNYGLSIRLLVHLVGDIHQPFHCINLFTPEFPNGDDGGNLFDVYYGNKMTNIHAFWDTCGELFTKEYTFPLTSSSVNEINTIALQLINYYDQSEVIYSTNFSSWALESYNIASNFGYTVATGKQLSLQYINQTRHLCTQRMYEAGMRLAWLLQM